MIKHFKIIIVLLPTLLLCSCAGATLSTSIEYYKDLKVCLGKKCYTGSGTLPVKKKYDFTIEAESQIEILYLQSAMQENVVHQPREGKGPFKSKKKAKLTFSPVDKDVRGPILFTALDRKNGRHSWAFLAMASSLFTCEILCNGKKLKNTDVVCQAKAGTDIKFLTNTNYLNIKEEKNIFQKKGDYYTVVPGVSTFVGGTKEKFCTIYILGYETYPLRD